MSRLNKLFAQRQINKTYWAIVKNPPQAIAGTLTHFLRRNTKQNKSYAYAKAVPDSKKAILDFKLINKLKSFSLLEIALHTGRHHQIRSQLAAIGSPIKGDLKYGAARSNPDGSISLHARKLSLIHPIKKEEITFVAPVPVGDAVWEACEN